MKNGKYSKRRGVASKTLVLALAVMLIVGATVGGTIAWLTAQTESVVNTFSATDIKVTLEENKGLNEQGKWKNAMVPGVSYDKDPVVTVTDETTVDCYLFVKFVENDAARTYLNYTSTLTEANGWKVVPDETDVWYRIVKTTDETKSWNLLEGDKVTVNGETVTKENMATASQASLTYKAFAVQLSSGNGNFAPEVAWAKVAPTT